MSTPLPAVTNARDAAFNGKKKKVPVVFNGFTYIVRMASMKAMDEIMNSEESHTRKSVRLIIACTYWPDDAPPDENGKARAGTPMFSAADFDAILSEDDDPDSVWKALIDKITEIRKKTPPSVEEQLGNSKTTQTSTNS